MVKNRVSFENISSEGIYFYKRLNQIEYKMRLDPLGIEFEFSVIIQCTFWTHLVSELKD